MFLDIVVLKRNRALRFFAAPCLVALVLLCGASNVSAMEDPQTAERIWSMPNLEKIQKNFKGPQLSKEEAGETKILISFILHPDGHLQYVKAVKQSGDSRARADIPAKKFKKIEKALVEAIKTSAPLIYRKQPQESQVPWGVLFVYCPKEYSFGRMVHVARGQDHL